MALWDAQFCTGSWIILELYTICLWVWEFCHSKLEHGLFAPFSYMCPVGAGCIWNDILDRDFDRKVGKLADNWSRKSCLNQFRAYKKPTACKRQGICRRSTRVSFSAFDRADCYDLEPESHCVSEEHCLLNSPGQIWLHSYSFRLGIMAIYFLPGIYPLMKRITFWPQAWLGNSINTSNYFRLKLRPVLSRTCA